MVLYLFFVHSNACKYDTRQDLVNALNNPVMFPAPAPGSDRLYSD
ncbi:MAG: hypothetical protein U9N40_06170 [Euryarchaeota archaeon]|nr:hypothetical protein [Euryarchaeota archaeon]